MTQWGKTIAEAYGRYQLVQPSTRKYICIWTYLIRNAQKNPAAFCMIF